MTDKIASIMAAKITRPVSPKPKYDCIVLGLGAMGSSCIYQLARRGANVLGLEQFKIGHVLGSSGGISRQTKVMPYLGGPFEPLIKRANENWKRLETESKQKVLHQCGFLQLAINQDLPSPDETEIELFDETILSDRFPQFQKLPKGTNGLLDKQGGLLRSELAIVSNCYVASIQGAHIRDGETVKDWYTDNDGVTVKTTIGKYRAKHLVIAAGAWNGKIFPQLRKYLQVTRLSLGWFTPNNPEIFKITNCPTWIHGNFYGFPILQGLPGFKIAKHWHGDPTDPDHIKRKPNVVDETLLRDYLGRHIPSANGQLMEIKICMYTHGGPILGIVPDQKRVTVVSACNGGGFKFSSAYGEALADLATQGKTDIPIEFMALN
jgi:sarcosine oxidase